MLRALFEHYGTLLRFDRRELYGFWGAGTLAGTTEQELRALKVGYRAKPLLRVSEAIAAGQLNSAALRGGRPCTSNTTPCYRSTASGPRRSATSSRGAARLARAADPPLTAGYLVGRHRRAVV
jgi:hypothetical protein